MKNIQFKKLRQVVLACAALVMAGGAMAQGSTDVLGQIYGERDALNARVNNAARNADANARNECIGPRCADGPGTVGFNEGRRCFAAMREWDQSQIVDTHGPLSMWTPPDYDCYKSAMLNRMAGSFSMNWTAPSVAEYRAWVLAYTEYSEQPAVKRTAADAKADVDAFGDAFHLKVVKPDANYNLGLLADGKTYLLNANPMLKGLPGGTGRSSGLGGSESVSEVCSKSQRDATMGIENKIVRDLALKKLKITCAGAEEKVAASKAAAAAAEAKQSAYQLPTEADLRSSKDTMDRAKLLEFFAQDSLPSRTIGAADAPAKMQVVLDFADWRTRLLLLRIWPAVIDGQLKLQIVPTSLGYFRPEADAAFLATSRPVEFIQNWLTKSLDKTGPAGATVLEVQTASTKSAPGVVLAHKADVLKTNEFVEKSGIRILPRIAISRDTMPPTEGVWLSNSTGGLLKEVGINPPNIYTKEQVAFLRQPWAFTNLGKNGMSRSYLPYGKSDAPIFEPDFSSAKELCSAEKAECWKVPAAGSSVSLK